MHVQGDEKETNGVVIQIQDEQQTAIQDETVQVVSNQGVLIGQYKSSTHGYLQLPTLPIGSYTIALHQLHGYKRKEPIEMNITKFNQSKHTIITIVMNKKQKESFIFHPTFPLFILTILSVCSYGSYYLFRKKTFVDALDGML